MHTLRELLTDHVATRKELEQAEDAAKKEACFAPRGSHSETSRMIEEKVLECRTWCQAAEIMKSVLNSDELDRPISGDKVVLFVPMMIAKRLLIQTYEKNQKK